MIPPRRHLLLAAVSILLLAFNLRPIVNSLGAVVPDMRADTGLSATAVGVLLSLPVLAFAVVGLAGPGLAARFGPHRTVIVALGALVVGLGLRAAVPGNGALFGGSLLALAGIAVTNVMLPGLVRLHFEHRIPTVTAAYTTAITVGSALAALSIPISHALGGDWRFGIGIWAAPALLALLPWLALSRRVDQAALAGPGVADAQPRIPLRSLARTRLAWFLALYFGIQATLAYVTFGWLPEILDQRGLSANQAAVHLVIIITLGIPPALVAPRLLTRTARPEYLVIVLSCCYVAGFLGLVVARGASLFACSALIGLGTGAFSVALSLVALRSRSHLVTTSLSAFTQCVGYLIATVGPLGLGALYEVTGSWTLPLVLLAAAAVAQAVFGALVVRSGPVEGELPTRRSGASIPTGTGPGWTA